MQSLHVFDMDGTLFDTREATKLAYEAAGLPEYKPEYWGKSAAEWGCPRDIHKRKHAHYLSFANVIQPAWAYPFYEVAGAYSAVILTGASEDTVDVLRGKFDTPLPTPFGCGLSADDKRNVLARLTRVGWKIYYYDDQVETAIRIVDGLDRVDLVTEGDLQ